MLAVMQVEIILKNQFRLKDGAEDFTAEVHVIKVTITYAHQSGLLEHDSYSFS